MKPDSFAVLPASTPRPAKQSEAMASNAESGRFTPPSISIRITPKA